MSSRLLGADWTVAKVLDSIIKSDPPFHVLIDTGALITGMSNYGVARYMLTHGLSTDFDGVVFLDHRDRKMIVSVGNDCFTLFFCFSAKEMLSYLLTHRSYIVTQHDSFCDMGCMLYGLPKLVYQFTAAFRFMIRFIQLVWIFISALMQRLPSHWART